MQRLSRWPFVVLIAVLMLESAQEVWGAAPPRRAEDPRATPQQVRSAIDRGLAFLEADAKAWRKERKCATCHHGTMTVWAFTEARNLGYPVKAEAVADLTKWTTDRFFANLDEPRDKRPGWSMVSTPALYLGVMARAVPRQEVISSKNLERICGHLLRHQEADGSWAWSSAPAKNRPPPHFESDEVATLLGCLVTHRESKGAVRASQERALAWLAKNRPTRTTQSLALGVWFGGLEGQPRKYVDSHLAELLRRQNRDGGWGQDSGLPSDPYATGQSLYFLNLAGVEPRRLEIRRGVDYLVANQKLDGRWPMQSRAHEGERPMSNPVPITYLGSAWATLGLMRSVPR